jgi:hypothetical protein
MPVNTLINGAANAGEAKRAHDYTLLYIVSFILVVFYFAVMSILRSGYKERDNALKSRYSESKTPEKVH